jgi:hypothetical protein
MELSIGRENLEPLVERKMRAIVVVGRVVK